MKSKKNPLTTKIKLAMLESGLNQTELAKAIGITKQSLSGWLSSCENPKLENIKKIAKATNKPVNYFFENSGNNISNNKDTNMFTHDGLGTGNVANKMPDNVRLTLIEKDMELIKKDIEIIKLKLNENKNR